MCSKRTRTKKEQEGPREEKKEKAIPLRFRKMILNSLLTKKKEKERGKSFLVSDCLIVGLVEEIRFILV